MKKLLLVLLVVALAALLFVSCLPTTPAEGEGEGEGEGECKGIDPVSYDRVSFRIISVNYIIKFKLFVFLRKTEIFKDYVSNKEIGGKGNEKVF